MNEDVLCPKCEKWIDLEDWSEKYWNDGDIEDEECPYCGENFKVYICFPRPDFRILKEIK